MGLVGGGGAPSLHRRPLATALPSFMLTCVLLTMPSIPPKAAIGLVSMDSANITSVTFKNISIEGADIATPIFVKLGNRAKGEAPERESLSEGGREWDLVGCFDPNPF